MTRAETEIGKASDATPKQQAARIKTARILSYGLLRTDVIDNNHSLEIAEEASRRGDAVIIAFTHPTRTDPPRAMIIAANQSELGKKEIIAPVAVHADNFLYHWIAKKTGATFIPIVTEDTLEKRKYKNRKLGEGKREFLDRAIDGINKGKTIFVAPQTKRMPYLGQPEKPTIGTIMIEAERKKHKNYSIIFIAFEIKGTKNYSEKKGLNIFKKNTANIGACLTREEIMERATELAKKVEEVSGKRENPFRFIDQVAYGELYKIAPDAYK